MKIHESAEDYLEQILMLKEQKGSVRSIDIAVAMGFSKPSVSIAMKNLRENGYISVDADGFITLEEPPFLWRWALTRTLPPTMPARSSMI